MERVLGPALGGFVCLLHESHGVAFHLGRTLAAIEAGRVRFDDGSSIDAHLVVVGIGVRPRIDLARQAGLVIDRGVLVAEYLETSAHGFAAAYSGDRPTVSGSPKKNGRFRGDAVARVAVAGLPLTTRSSRYPSRDRGRLSHQRPAILARIGARVLSTLSGLLG